MPESRAYPSPDKLHEGTSWRCTARGTREPLGLWTCCFLFLRHPPLPAPPIKITVFSSTTFPLLERVALIPKSLKKLYPKYSVFLCVYVTDFVRTQTSLRIKTMNYVSVYNLLCLALMIAHSKCSVNFCWTNERVDDLCWARTCQISPSVSACIKFRHI